MFQVKILPCFVGCDDSDWLSPIHKGLEGRGRQLVQLSTILTKGREGMGKEVEMFYTLVLWWLDG